MTREIKFRAWRKSWAMMVLPEWIQKYLKDEHGIYGITFNNPCTDGHSESETWDDVEDGDLVLMQYTGLKDKNGKEVYEGDVIEHWGCEHEEKDDSCKVEIYEIAFSDKMGAFVFKDETGEYFINTERNKVIGNIYEYPNLLES